MDSLPDEQWRAIPECDGYEASTHGRVRSISRTVVDSRGGCRALRGRVLRACCNAGGYPTTNLGSHRRNQMVHTLIAATWIGPRPDGLTINHKNGIKSDNRAVNLEYITQGDNNKHALDAGLRIHLRGDQCSRAVLTSDLVREIRATPKSISTRAIAERLGVETQAVYYARTRRTWKHII